MHKQIIDFFTYFDKTSQELLQLRINVLKNHVDKFIICEPNKTPSGLANEAKLSARIKELNLPKEKIEIISLDIPEDEDLNVQVIDVINSYENNNDNKTHDSIRARARERLQKDSLLSKLEESDENTLFIVSDIEEIVAPKYINWIADTVVQHKDHIIKLPLVLLEGKADLRVYTIDNNFKKWDNKVFMCTKSHLLKSTPNQIRSDVDSVFPVAYMHVDNKRVEDLGWYFSWMGGVEKREIKRTSFTYYNDKVNFIKGNYYNSSEMAKLHKEEPEAGKIAPCGQVDTILKPYQLDLLPQEIFIYPVVKQFLIPEKNIDNVDILQQEYTSACNQQTDIHEHLPILKELAQQCSSVIEMGTKTGQSTRAFLYSCDKVVAYDLELNPQVFELFRVAKNAGKNVNYIQANVLNINIEETDLLFIDTWHVYEQLKQELELHADKAKKYLVLHDTETFGTIGENGTSKGLLPAIMEFLSKNSAWKIKEHRTNNNGLTILERTSN